MKRIGLALGGGGVRGLAHIPVLELLDELALRPCAIAGTSMGAVLGALYASGLSGRRIRELVEGHTIMEGDTFRDVLGKRSSLLEWVGALMPRRGGGGLIDGERFLSRLFAGIGKSTFAELEIPLIVVATDYWAYEEVVFTDGELLPAIRASMAVPGAFKPVVMDGRVLVDGGIVNLVPYDHLRGRCDVTVAVEVGRDKAPGRREPPGVLHSILGAFDILQTAALDRKLADSGPEILVRMRIRDVEILDFTKAAEVFRQAKPEIARLRKRLAEVAA